MEIEKFRFPGEFEPQTDVFINWLPDYCAGEDGDKGREVLVEVVKNLLGHVNVHVNCGCETSLEACKQMLADAGVDVSDPDTEGQRNTAADNGDEKFSPFIRFTQFDDWSVSIRDNGPDVMIDDEGNTLAVNMLLEQLLQQRQDGACPAAGPSLRGTDGHRPGCVRCH